jgi:hypothetical protein
MVPAVGDSDLAGRRAERPPSLAALIREGDPDAVAGFYDGRAGSVREYCATLCPAGLVDAATLAAFVDFLGRLENAGDDADVDELVLQATRTSAAGRLRIVGPTSAVDRLLGRGGQAGNQPECQSMPELLAAEANGELPAEQHGHREHLEDCRVCRVTEARLREAEWAFIRQPEGQPGLDVRRRWLEIAARRGEPIV